MATGSRLVSAGLAAARAAAGRGAEPAEALARGLAAEPRHLFLDTSAGLEQVLEREIRSLGIIGRLNTYPGGVSLEGPEESLWRVALESRVVERVRLRLGRPFYAPYASTLHNHTNGIAWSNFLWFGTEPIAPPIRVTSKKSRLFHTKMIEERVSAVIEEQRQTYMKRKLQNVGDREFYSRPDHMPGSALPTVHVEIQQDECQISLAATDVPRHRTHTYSAIAEEEGYTGVGIGAAEDPPRPLVYETHAAAAVLRTRLFQHLEDVAETGRELVLWDPFCGSGALLLEALGVCLGVPPSSPAVPFPFTRFPHFDKERYGKVVRSLKISPHPALSRLTLLGFDSSAQEIGAAGDNLARFLRTMPRPRHGPLAPAAAAPIAAASSSSSSSGHGARLLPCAVDFLELREPADVIHHLQGRPTMILTCVPFGRKTECGKARLAYEQFGAMVREQASAGSLRDVYCLSAREGFKHRCGLEWRTELRFHAASGIRVDLLRWTGQAVEPAVVGRATTRKRTRRSGKNSRSAVVTTPTTVAMGGKESTVAPPDFTGAAAAEASQDAARLWQQ